MMTIGLGGVKRGACVALTDAGRVIGICKQERINRVRDSGFPADSLPDDAIQTLLERNGLRRDAVNRYVIAEPWSGTTVDRLDHDQAHAATAYLSSPFAAATIVVCDDDAALSVWAGAGASLRRVEWPWSGPGLKQLYSESATLCGLTGRGADQRFEALARLAPEARDDRLRDLWTTDGHRLAIQPGWQAHVERLLDGSDGLPPATRLAGVLQNRVAELATDIIGAVSKVVGGDALCLGGGLFYHSSINSAIACSSHFPRVFVPIDPGDAGLAVGCAMHADAATPSPVAPFLGPSYTPVEIKSTLDNCKLRYTWANESQLIDRAVDALCDGLMVGWFEGAMEWGPRALGARSILANPFAPYVLENLNRFLKHRESWRGYSLTSTETAVKASFEGPPAAPLMEYDYRPIDPRRFERVLPSPTAAVRIHTIDSNTPRRFARVVEAFGERTGSPFLVNTSFNGFREPIVCSPRDAVRVFFGTGLDVMFVDQFVVQK